MAKRVKKVTKFLNISAAKQTKSKEKQAKKESPKNNRVITEPIHNPFAKEHTWLYLLSIFALITIVVEGIRVAQDVGQYREVLAAREKIQQEIARWERMEMAHPGYRDGYVQLALLEYQLGNIQKTRDFLQHALAIDPNFSYAIALKRLVEKNI